MAKKTTPKVEFKLLLFTKERCAPCAVAKPQVEKAAAATGLPLELVDVFSEQGERLLLPLNILSVPTLVLLRDGKKAHEFTGGKELTEKLLTEKLTKILTKEATA